MSNAYLDLLPLPPEAREQLAGLGVPSPEALLSMMQAAPKDFERLLGPKVARECAADLKALIDKKNLWELEHFPLPQPPLGARLEAAPHLPADFGTRERDRLFGVYQRLQQEAEQSPAARRQLAAVENQLNVLLEPLPAAPSRAGGPVVWLIPYLARAPFRVVAERADRLHELLKKLRLSIQVRDADVPRVVLAAATDGPADFGQRVVFDLETTTRWWAYAATYRDLVLACVGAGSAQVEAWCPPPASLVQRARVMSQPGPASLQRWDVPPPNLSEPAEGPPTAEELFLDMGACALLRVIGHAAAPGPGAGPDPYAADRWAAEWALEDWRAYGAGAEDRVFVTRALGIVFALSCLAEGGRAPGRGANRPARLLHFLSPFVEREGTRSLPWWAACWLVLLHSAAAGQRTPWTKSAASPAEFLQAAAEAEGGRR
jgi:hypothetical protein